PEFTGRICPAPCEAACTLNITDEPVTIKTIECAIVDEGWKEGWVEPQVPAHSTDKRVGIVGSGPAGLACAQQLARAGHRVVVFEKNNKIGGLLRYGIPDFKLDKGLIDRRMSQLQAEGVVFLPNSHVGVNYPVEDLLANFDAIALTGGSEFPRDLEVPGRELDGVHFAMRYLSEQNRRNSGEALVHDDEILATAKHVIVIGGGDTGSDCVGTARRQGAASITQMEIMPRPPEKEDKNMTWPDWPMKLRTSSSHEEGCERDWSIATKAFKGEGGKVTSIQCVRLEWSGGKMEEIAGSEFDLPADLVFLAMGFVNPVHEGMLDGMGIEYDQRGNVDADTNQYKTSLDKVFAAGDMRRGQSLVVWAIREGRQCAHAIDEFLMGDSDLAR
ncbi:MAG: glutamate synthase subunit beta, partial [Alphaproteobacteria bacterium]|nr:glutamate synthase subunit beta [Alphaproteobacteria bacterium]